MLISMLTEDGKFSEACSTQFWMECPWKFPRLFHTASPICPMICSFLRLLLINIKHLQWTKQKGNHRNLSSFAGELLMEKVFNFSRAETKTGAVAAPPGGRWLRRHHQQLLPNSSGRSFHLPVNPTPWRSGVAGNIHCLLPSCFLDFPQTTEAYLCVHTVGINMVYWFYARERNQNLGGCREEEIEDRKERRGKKGKRRAEEQGPISNTSFSLKCSPITRKLWGCQIVYWSLYSLAFSKEWA